MDKEVKPVTVLHARPTVGDASYGELALQLPGNMEGGLALQFCPHHGRF